MIECWIIVEDFKKFYLSLGKIIEWIVFGGVNVCFDLYVYVYYVVFMYYDFMIGKFIVWGENRERVIVKMKRVLKEFKVEGIKMIIFFYFEMFENVDFR